MHVPKEVSQSLKRLDDQLVLLYNIDDFQWELYRIKQKGITEAEDLLHHQLSLKTGNLSTGIVDYIKKFDQNPMGANSQDEMRKYWMQSFKRSLDRRKDQKEKQKQELHYAYKQGEPYLFRNRTGIAVPITVGFNTKTGKKILAVPINA